MSGFRVFFGPADAELLGMTDEGVPVVADEDGAGPMVEVGGLIESFGFPTLMEPDDEDEPPRI